MTTRSSRKLDASRTTRNGSFIGKPTQTPPEGTGLTISFLWSKPMSKVVYRGIEYDTEKRIAYQQQMMQQPQQQNEVYRGVKFVKEGHK